MLLHISRKNYTRILRKLKINLNYLNILKIHFTFKIFQFFSFSFLFKTPNNLTDTRSMIPTVPGHSKGLAFSLNGRPPIFSTSNLLLAG